MKVNKTGPGLTYVAAPYTHDDPGMVETRKAAVDIWAAALMNMGVPALSPLSYESALKDWGISIMPAEEWYRFDRQLMQTCDRIVIMGLPGWEQSRGVSIEIAHAQENDMPIYLNGLAQEDRIWPAPTTAMLPDEPPAEIVQIISPYCPGPHNERARRRAAQAAGDAINQRRIEFSTSAYRMTMERMGTRQDDAYWQDFASRLAGRSDLLVVDRWSAEEPDTALAVRRARGLGIPVEYATGEMAQHATV